MKYVIKTEIKDATAVCFEFESQKTMYGGKKIAVGNVLYIFASENEGGQGLIACGIVTSSQNAPNKPNITRQTPRVNVSIKIKKLAKLPLGRNQLKNFKNWNDGKPQTELNFKLYRQATNKIVGISDNTADFLDKFF